MICSHESGVDCLTPHCGEKAMPSLACGHHFCSRCLLGVVKFSCPEYPLLVLKCPLCRAKQGFCPGTFFIFMHEHYPEGSMLLECEAPCEGFCLATWEAVNVATSRRSVRFNKTLEHWKSCFTYLPACSYIHLLEETSADNVVDDTFVLRRLYDLLSQRTQCLEDSKQLLREAADDNVRTVRPVFPNFRL